jgi:bacterioferritin-associated ferredoxin
MRTFLCLCHDVTVEDVERAVAAGYTHPETIKRFTGAFMGPCQGKWCGELVLREIARLTGLRPDELRPPPARPPALPVRLGRLAGGAGR